MMQKFEIVMIKIEPDKVIEPYVTHWQELKKQKYSTARAGV